MPDRAEGIFDIRVTENDDLDFLLEELRSELHSEIQILRREPLFFAGKSPYLDLLLETAPHLEQAAEHGASDARFLSEAGIPGIVWGAEGNMSQHSPVEHVEMASVVSLRDVLHRFLDRIEKSGFPLAAEEKQC